MARVSRGFVYYLSLTGITGVKLTDKVEVGKKVREIRRYTKTPVAVGFGIKTHDDVREIARIAAGGASCAARLGSFTRSLKSATTVLRK